MPACSSARPSVFALRPVAIKRWLPSIAGSPSPTTTLIFAPVPSTRRTATLLRPSATPPPAEAGNALLRSVRAVAGGTASAGGWPLPKSVARGPRRYAEGARLRDGAGVLCGGDQRFRGHTTGVETFAPHLALLDQHD